MASFERLRPEPGNFWIRFAPRRWAGPDTIFLDLARGTLAGPRLQQPSSGPALDGDLDDLVYVPAVAGEIGSSGSQLAADLAAAGVPALVQLLPGQITQLGLSEGSGTSTLAGWRVASTLVCDLTPALLGENLPALGTVPPDTGAAWPLIPGCSDDEALWREGLDRLVAAGVRWVQAVVPELSAADRRRLAEHRDVRSHQALFHGADPDVRRFAKLVAQQGLELFPPRPLAGSTGRLESNRRLAAHLAVLGELWHLADRPESRGQAFFRAARWVEAEDHDIAEVAAQGNLGVVDWLDPAARAAIEAWDGRRTALWGELMEQIASTGPA